MIEEIGIMPSMVWQIALLLVAVGIFLFGFACVIFAAQSFLTVAVVEIKKQIASSPNSGGFPGLGFDLNQKMKDFWKDRLTPTEGGFDPYNEEDMWINERIEELRATGVLDESMSQQEMQSFVKKAIRESGLVPKPAGE